MKKPQTDRYGRVIHQFTKNANEVVRFSLTRYAGRYLADIRVYFETDSGKWQATRKGVSVGVEDIDALLAGVSKLKDALNGE